MVLDETSPWSVVIADDDIGVRALLRTTLDRDDRFVVVGEAHDGVEALDAVDQADPDLLLLDLDMPRVDGFEVLEALRPEPRPTVVVLTGLADVDEGRVLAAGAVRHLTKGTAFNGLADHLAQTLDAQESTTEDPRRLTETGPDASST